MNCMSVIKKLKCMDKIQRKCQALSKNKNNAKYQMRLNEWDRGSIRGKICGRFGVAFS